MIDRNDARQRSARSADSSRSLSKRSLSTRSLSNCSPSKRVGTSSARRRLATTLLQGTVAGGLLCVAVLNGCQKEPPFFDPRSLELGERRGADEKPLKLEEYPTTLQATPVPQNIGSTPGGTRPPNEAYISTLPATGRSYSEADAVQLSLREAVARALLYNSEVKVAGYDPAINANRVQEQAGVFDPVAFTELRTDRTNTGLSDGTLGLDNNGNPIGNQISGFTDKTQTNLGQTGVRQKTAYGSQFQLTYGWSFNRVDNFPAGQDSKFWQNDLQLEFNQPLLRDFGRDVTTARLEIARGDQKISVLDFRKAIEEQLSNLEQAYWQLYQANRIVLIQESLLAETIETYRVLYERWIKGLDASEVPVSQAQSSVKARQADLIRAKQQVRDLSDEVKRRMNDPALPVSSSYIVVPTDAPLDAPVSFSYASSVDSAVVNRLELGQQALRIEQARIAEKVSQNNLLPRLDLIGRWGYRGLGEDGSNASKNMWQFDNPSWSIGLQFEYPIGNQAAHAVNQRARLQRLQAIETYRGLLNTISNDVKQSLNSIESSWEQAIARTQSRLASRRQLDLIQKQQDLGEPITPSFVQVKLQAQEEYANAAREEATSIADYNVAIQRLERSKGTLLKYNNVQIREDFSTMYLDRKWVAQLMKQ